MPLVNSKSFFEFDEGLSRAKTFGCIYEEARTFKNSKLPYLLYMDKDCILKDVNVPEYVEYLNRLGFPIVLSEDSEFWIGSFSSKDFKGGNMHFLAAFTALRYSLKSRTVFNSYPYDTDDLIKDALDFSKSHAEIIDEFEAFQLAHYSNLRGYFDGDHVCFNRVSKFVTLEDLQKMLNANVYSVNSLFFKEEIKSSWDALHDLCKKDIDSVIKLLK